MKKQIGFIGDAGRPICFLDDVPEVWYNMGIALLSNTIYTMKWV